VTAGADNDLSARDLAVFWHPASQLRDLAQWPPLEVIGARGCRITLADGRQILDGISSWWCKSLGHGHPRLRAALTTQLDAFEHVIVADLTFAPLVALCERLLAVANVAGPAPAPSPPAPAHFAKVFLADNGSTAVEIAVKMALQAQVQRGQPGRTRFAALANGYHGETIATLSVGDVPVYAQPYRGLMFPVEKVQAVPYRSGPEDPRWQDASEEWPAIEAQLRPLARELAAIVYEPVLQAAGGMRVYSPDLLRRLRAFTDHHGIYLIADEIAAGMGRCGAMLASHLAAPFDSALPDFAVLSKGLTGGFLPLSAVLTTDAIRQLFDGQPGDGRAFLHSNTYTGNALGVAVALAALEVYEEERILDQVAATGPALRAAVAALAARRPDLRHPRGCGMVAAIDLTDVAGNPRDPRARTGYQVCREAMRRGALLRPLGDTLYLFPPLTATPAEIEELAGILGESVDAVVPLPAAR
jgi:adenosylmethionine-8-amino-7-oxononanoate aminotransferase